MYRAKYKCRLCGRTYFTSVTGREDVAWEAVCNVVWNAKGVLAGKPVLNQPGTVDVHSCEDGSFGIADFLGMEWSEK